MKQCNSKTKGSHLPLISISIVAISFVLYLCGDLASFLQYDRSLIEGGELWRGITGHWTHYSFDHFLWCSISFIALGSICELLNRKGFVISLAASAVFIPAVSWFFDQEMLFYRGLSGLCSSVFMVGALLTARNAFTEKDWAGLILPVAGGGLFFIKILVEFVSGQALFVQESDLFSPVPMAHLAGGAVGLLTGMIILFQSQKKFSS